MNNIEQAITDSIKKGLIDKADKLIESKLVEIKSKLWEEASVEIDRVMNSLYVSSFDNTRSMTKEVHVSLKGNI